MTEAEMFQALEQGQVPKPPVPMPPHWALARVVVQGHAGDYGFDEPLSFVITQEEQEDSLTDRVFTERLQKLRQALWDRGA